MRGKKLTDSIKFWFSLVLDINPTQSEQKKAIKNFAHIHIYATLTRLSLTCHEITVLNPYEYIYIVKHSPKSGLSHIKIHRLANYYFENLV